jgi:hypothetical protein
VSLRIASFQQSVTLPAEDLRAGLVKSLTGTTGIAQPTAMAVTAQGTPNMTVAVAAGGALIPGTQSANQGVYGVWNDASVNVTIGANGSGNPRIDLVVVMMNDIGGGYAAPPTPAGTTSNAPQFQVVQGTPAGSPTPPATPVNAVPLAQIAVANGASSITNGNITDVRPIASASGGIVATPSTVARLPAVANGLPLWFTDTYKLLIGTTATTRNVPPWNLPWGPVVAPVIINAATGGFGVAASDINLAVVTWTAVANRRYRISINIPRCIQATAAGEMSIIMTDTGNTLRGDAGSRWFYYAAGVNYTAACDFAVVETITTAGSVTRKFRGSASGGSFTADCLNFPGYVLVEDIGPSANPL